MSRSRSALLAILTTLTILGGAGCRTGPEPRRHEYVRILLGGAVRITLYHEDEAVARGAATAAFQRIEDLNRVLSDYRPDSEVSRLAGEPAGRPVPVSTDLGRAIARAIEISEASGGSFDVTVGPIVGLWREAQGSGRLPAPAAIEDARARTGWRLLALDPVGGTVTLGADGMRLDFGGIGKGLCADEALRTIADLGIERAIVDAEGDIAIGAPPPGRDGWRIAVESGLGDDPVVLELARCGVATSGDLERFVEIDGRRYSHIVDPRTGVGLTRRVAVTVVARDAATADALASALSVLGAGDGLALLDRFPPARARITEIASGERRTVSTLEAAP